MKLSKNKSILGGIMNKIKDMLSKHFEKLEENFDLFGIQILDIKNGHYLIIGYSDMCNMQNLGTYPKNAYHKLSKFKNEIMTKFNNIDEYKNLNENDLYNKEIEYLSQHYITFQIIVNHNNIDNLLITSEISWDCDISWDNEDVIYTKELDIGQDKEKFYKIVDKEIEEIVKNML